jgi:phytoene dehydrogenase-like protein
MTIQEFAAGFKDPFLQRAIRFFIDSPGWPMQRFPMSIMAGMMNSGIRESGVPLGGSQQAINKIAGFYGKLGGQVRYKTRVAGLLIENDQAVGVRLENGEELRADEIVWAADGHTAIFDMLGGRYLSEEIRNMYESWIPVQPIVHVMIGVDRDFSAEPHSVIFKTDKPISVGAEDREWLGIIHHCFDESMAPAGKSAVEVWYATGWEYWNDLSADTQRYQEEKKRIADETIAALERRWPGFASKVEFVDVPTPITYMSYTSNWKASPDGWYVTPENMMKQEPVRSLPGLEHFHMVGQWTAPFAGTVVSAVTGRQLIQILCKKDRRKFVTAAG